MIRKYFRHIAVSAACALLGAQVVHAHHSRIAFDEGKLVSISGEVTRMAWRNPHVAINVEVTNDSGERVLWKIEGLPPSQIDKRGLNRQSIKVGDTISLDVRPLKKLFKIRIYGSVDSR